ncbi:MAG: glycoside hydrolase family 13 protein [Lachnospiraceae bacterium]|nr:glycoside hydrolase family 13 protein [Butyrivibrio sp.]MCM1345196.1 glycoside hydrolase family 13 protein [Muribaculaceae bacterium]MCM1409927.1 glycoside hydrolase family 13 protein [Lachnospiraceae bacterium]
MSLDLEKIKLLENNRQYISTMRPVFNKRALFSDTTGNYISPAEPEPFDRVTIKFRTAKNNVDRVLLVHKGERHLMYKSETEGNFDYYTFELQLEQEKAAYYFEILTGKLRCYYDTRGLAQDVNEYYDFVIIPGFKTPDWAKGAVMYQIYVDRFCNGDLTNDVLTNEYAYINKPVNRVEDWGRYPAQMDVREFYGGDLQGVLDKMDYLQDLGVEVIYFNPLFVSPSNHKYDIQDYDYIDPHFGRIVDDKGELLPEQNQQNCEATRYINRVTNLANLEASNELFIRVVEEAHRRGMRVILDGVFNHCGSFNKWMDRERIYENAKGYEKGAYISADSPYRDYFQFHDQNRWPYNGSYDGWWGHDTLPKLNYEGSQNLTEYVLEIARKWVSPPYSVDGWRLDVAADLGHSQDYNHKFWQEFRRVVKESNPDAIILAEHYGNTRDWLQGNEWDTVMNYDAFMEPVTWFLTGMEKHSDDFREDLLGNAESFWGAMQHHTASFTMPSWQVAMNELSNHDHSRFLTRTNHKVGRISTMGSEAANQNVNKAVFMEAVVMQMTWIGAPTIYYGDEAGVCGFTDPDSRRTYPWGREDKELISFHRDIIRLRRENDELRTGSLKYLESDYNYLAYGRFHRGGQCLILINNNNHPVTKRVFVWEVGIPKVGKVKALIQTDENGYHLDGQEYEVNAGKIVIELPKTSAIILKGV